jgi:uncharacterized protein
MAITTSPIYRAAATGVVSAALLVGAFSLGVGRGGGSGQAAAATLTSASTTGHITVTGTGTVTGVPNQLILSMSIQVNGSSVTSALTQADQTVRRVTAALRNTGVQQSDIQTSGLQISPNYQNNSQVPTSYGVSESMTVTMNQMKKAGIQIDAAVRAGGNAVTVDNVSMNLTSTGALMAAARASAVANAKAQAQQFASALGEQLGPVISITPVQQSMPQQFDYANGAAVPKASSVPISPGTQQLTVTITVVYAA